MNLAKVPHKKLLPAALLVILLSLHASSAFYDPGLQRWLNRDPFGEAGSINLHCFAGDNPVGMVDAWGEDALPTVPNYDLKGNSTGDGNAVTRYTVLKLIVTEVSVDGCDCCVKAATSDYRIQTDFNTTRADVHTILHEQVHAYADWQLANVAFPLAIVGLKNHCLKAKHWTEEECKAAQQVEAAKATSAIDANANGLLNVMAHTMIGSVGWNATGQDKFTKWLGLWLPSWQDDMLRYRQGKFW